MPPHHLLPLTLILLSISSGDSAVVSHSTSHCQPPSHFYLTIFGIVTAAIVIGGGTVVLLWFLFHRNPQWFNFGMVLDDGDGDADGDGDGDADADAGGDADADANAGGDASPGQSDIAIIPQVVARFRVSQLNRATNNFNEKNRLGRSGAVFRGILGGREVIVKRVQLGVRNITVNVKHMNLVKFIGYALDDNGRYMVYEEAKEVITLSAILFGSSEGKPTLTWNQKLVIALDIARGISYLHGLSGENYVHGDLKASNILVISEGLRAKVAGYALVESEPNGNSSSSVLSRYLAPEYEGTGHANAQMDVYAFGVILLELCIGKQAPAEELFGQGHNFVNWTRVIPMISHTGMDAADPDAANIRNVIKLAYCCTGHEPPRRPAMETLVTQLQPLVVKWIPPTDEEISSDEAELGKGNLSERIKRWEAGHYTSSSS